MDSGSDDSSPLTSMSVSLSVGLPIDVNKSRRLEKEEPFVIEDDRRVCHHCTCLD